MCSTSLSIVPPRYYYYADDANPNYLDVDDNVTAFRRYPRLPRHNLRRARTLVKAICKKHDIHYHEPSFFEGNVEMWHALKDAAMGARKTTKGDGGFYQSMLWEGMNAKG